MRGAMTTAPLIDFGRNCSWCGHAPHPYSCPGSIVTGKAGDTRPCPCIRGAE